MKVYAIERRIHDPAIRRALRQALSDDGRLSDGEVISLLDAAYAGQGIGLREIRDLKEILENARTLTSNGRGMIGSFIHYASAAPALPSAAADDQLTRNFRLREFHCKDGTPVPPKYMSNVKKLAENLQIIRDRFKASITINCGYRTPSHNNGLKAKGAASNSQHLYAKAADIRVAGMAPQKVHDALDTLMASGAILQGGLGRYNSFTHYDIRGTRARWGVK